MTDKPKFQTPTPFELNEILAQARAARTAALHDAFRTLFARLRGLFGANGARRSA